MKKWPDNYLRIQQQTPEWLEVRCGCVTASRIGDVVAKLKNGKESAARASYKLEVLTEILTGRATEHYVCMAMDFGTENEPLARGRYEVEKEVEVERIGYIRHPTIKRAGCSPDGLVGDHGLVEFKVPNTTTHLQYLIWGEVPGEYLVQMMFQMACSGRQWCDFVSYDPRLPSEYGLFIVRQYRDEAIIKAMEAEVVKFLEEVNEMAEKLLSYKAEHSREPENLPGVPKAEIPIL